MGSVGRNQRLLGGVLQTWPLVEIRRALSFIGTAKHPNALALSVWHDCWDEIRDNADRGASFKTAYCYGHNPEGLPGRLQRNEQGFIEFVADDMGTGE